MSRIMTNFRAEDMPGKPVKKVEPKKPAAKKVEEVKPVVAEPVLEVKPAKPEVKRTGGGSAKPMVAE